MCSVRVWLKQWSQVTLCCKIATLDQRSEHSLGPFNPTWAKQNNQTHMHTQRKCFQMPQFLWFYKGSSNTPLYCHSVVVLTKMLRCLSLPFSSPTSTFLYGISGRLRAGRRCRSKKIATGKYEKEEGNLASSQLLCVETLHTPSVKGPMGQSMPFY